MCRKLKGVSLIGLWMIFVTAFFLFTAANVSAQGNPTIAVTAGAGGKITPDDDVLPVEVPSGTNKKFTITPNAYYHIDTVQAGPLGGAVSVYDSLTWNTTNKKIAYYKFVNVVENKEINATFKLDTRKLTISIAGTGTGTVSDDKALLDCSAGTSCTGYYEYDTGAATWPSVALTAEADIGSLFQGWFDAAGALLSKASPYTTKMSKNKKITAKFLKTYALTTSTDGEGTGTVATALVSGKSFGGGVYRAGSVIAVTARPDFGSNFTVWSDGASGTTKKVNVTMDADKNANATFTLAGAEKIATKVSVVDAKTVVTSPKPGVKALRIGPLLGAGWPPPGSDYELDKTNIYVEERSAEAFKTINEILCSIDQAKYAEMLNKGNYKAQIDKKLCSSGKDSASDAGQQSQNQSSGANMPDYELWTLNSSRASDSSPHIVTAWIHQKGTESEPDSLISAKVVITEGASEENPYGLFTLNFKANPIDPFTGRVFTDFNLFYGFLKTELDPVTNKVLLKFTDKFSIPQTVADQFGIDPMTFIEKATLDKRTDGTGKGTAYTFEKAPWVPDPAGESETFNFAFGQDYFRRAEVGVSDPIDLCLDRNNFDETVWSYGLYDSTTGARINRNSGFSIKKTEGPKDYYGWIGYWGVWFPEEVTVNDGDEVYRVTYGPGGSETLYNIFKSGGKLKRHQKNALTLKEITNVPLDYYLQTGEGPGVNYRAKWDGTDFTIFAKLDQMTNMWAPISGEDPTMIALSSLPYDRLFFYSQALNGNVQVKPNCSWVDDHFECTADDLTDVVFYSDELVYPGDVVPAQLACFNNCLDAGKLAAVPDPPATPFGDPLCDLTCQSAWADYMSWNPFNDYSSPQFDTVPAAALHATYTLDAATHVLQSDGADVLANKMHSNFQWGYMSGPLFDSTIIDFMACNLDGNLNPDTCGWLAWTELYEYYTWETGSNDWNQFIALEDPLVPGSVLTFDPPLLVSYVHEWDPINKPGVTSTFYLDYSGFGNLNGIPGKCVDLDTGAEIPCGPDSRWVPQFSIPEGSEVFDAAAPISYFVKPLEMEQRMAEAADPSSCDALTLKTYTLPDLAAWVDPNIGEEPVVEGPPAVIGGVLQ